MHFLGAELFLLAMLDRLASGPRSPLGAFGVPPGRQNRGYG
jgi:hypothetical protein